MNIPDTKKIIANIEARKLNEKIIIFGLLLLVVGYAWVLLVLDGMNENQAQLNRQLNVFNADIAEAAAQYVSIERNYQSDPDAFARNRQQELQSETIEVDEALRKLYGQLIQPRQMSQVLTIILQRETTLKLVSLENAPSTMLTSVGSGAVVPLVGESVVGMNDGLTDDNGLNVYRHGFRMVFEGDYLETIRYMRSLESLETSFFWQSLKYEVLEWPTSRITLDIFTLSTQEEWIGV